MIHLTKITDSKERSIARVENGNVHTRDEALLFAIYMLIAVQLLNLFISIFK